MHLLAQQLNRLSGGKLSPTAVTLAGLIAHLPIAWLIANNHLVLAAPLLLVFGLFDTLDGELARLQGTASPAGMLLDASTDRMKEVILYIGIAAWCVHFGHPSAAIWAVAAAGGSLLVSYVKAKGETAIASSGSTNHATVNRLFQDGLMRFEVRIGLLIIALLANQLVFGIALVALLSWGTAIQRLASISRKLRVHHD